MFRSVLLWLCTGNTNIFYVWLQSNRFHDKLYEILELSPPSSPDHTKENQSAVPVFEMQFPSLYVY